MMVPAWSKLNDRWCWMADREADLDPGRDGEERVMERGGGLGMPLSL